MKSVDEAIPVIAELIGYLALALLVLFGMTLAIALAVAVVVGPFILLGFWGGLATLVTLYGCGNLISRYFRRPKASVSAPG
jgi:hypothetical protein